MPSPSHRQEHQASSPSVKVMPGRRLPSRAAPASPASPARTGERAGRTGCPYSGDWLAAGGRGNSGAAAGCSDGRGAQSGRRGASSGTEAPVRAAFPAAAGLLLWAVPVPRPPHARPVRR